MQVISHAPFGALTDALAKMRDRNLKASEAKDMAELIRGDAQAVVRLLYEALSSSVPVFDRASLAEGTYTVLSLLEAADFLNTMEEDHE